MMGEVSKFKDFKVAVMSVKLIPVVIQTSKNNPTLRFNYNQSINQSISQNKHI